MPSGCVAPGPQFGRITSPSWGLCFCSKAQAERRPELAHTCKRLAGARLSVAEGRASGQNKKAVGAGTNAMRLALGTLAPASNQPDPASPVPRGTSGEEP